jgi:hypothetical protein
MDAFSKHLQQVASLFIIKNELRLSVLEIDNKTAVVLMGIVYNKVFNALTIGVNHALIQEIPWLNLTVHSIVLNIKNAIYEGCSVFDLLGGHHDYKYKLGGVDKGGVKITIYPKVASSAKLINWKPILRLIKNAFKTTTVQD